MDKQKFEASVIEDNGGGLSLYVFGEGGIDKGQVIWASDGYEYRNSLKKDLESLLEGSDPHQDWDGGIENAQESYDALDNYEYGWEVVAEAYDGKLHLFTKRMGAAASLAFGVESE